MKDPRTLYEYIRDIDLCINKIGFWEIGREGITYEMAMELQKYYKLRDAYYIRKRPNGKDIKIYTIRIYGNSNNCYLYDNVDLINYG